MTSPSAILQAVIPYFTIPDGHIGPVPIHPFGLLVATGIIVGHRLAMKRAAILGLDLEKFEKLVFWTVLTGIVLSHMLDTIFYHPQVLRDNPLELFMIHHGLSSFGGFFGAAIGYFVYSRLHKVDVWRSADAIAYGLPVGWFFGRTGCTVVHDHPGRASNSFLAMHFPRRVFEGGVLPEGNYFDLGLLELMCTPILIIAAFVVASRTKKPGAVIATITLLYPPIRFPLDYLRQPDPHGGDVRYFGFTPGQYACILCFLLGLYILRRTWKLPAEEPKKPEPPASKSGSDAPRVAKKKIAAKKAEV
jgi:phosphatidylglycerol:prolipoprotein diacylglycerol transferase